MPWSGEHRGFVVEAFYKNGESVTATQRAFRTRFGLRANESVPDRKTILLWVQRVRETGSALKRKPPGRPKNVRTPENIAAVRASIKLFPTRSARKHALALRISERTVRRILRILKVEKDEEKPIKDRGILKKQKEEDVEEHQELDDADKNGENNDIEEKPVVFE
ncbi:PREDICTED: uncharacterized protein LOC108567045 [Nicrophorus vespilloides]|uniref:Uncharacterized protein LOC108567045 n=1 Tax=Nicrophorus vespilloides TaxID=110193 RepID=A0ABM1N7C9_NICVS|nr:PREDICTED: uncharacterized protein LOC108567045 [Nicrophorus vespilloides]